MDSVVLSVVSILDIHFVSSPDSNETRNTDKLI